MSNTVKAVGDWELDVLGVPYGGPDDLDTDGEYFSRDTQLHEDKYPLPPAVYYHGYDPDGQPSGEPSYIGKTVRYEDREDGRWYRVVLDKASELAKRVWEAAQSGLARASSGSVAHLARRANGGHITHWPVAELSLFDMGDGRAPANRHAVAIPVMKAVYQQAGLTLPDELNDGGGNAEAQGDRRTPQSPGAADSGAVKSKQPQPMEDENMGEINMEELARAAAEAAREAVKAEREEEKTAREAEEARQAELDEAKAEAVKAAREEWEAEAAKGRRLPFGADDAPVVGKFGELRQYDNISADDMAVALGVYDAAFKGRVPGAGRPVSEQALKSLAIKMLDENEKQAIPALKAAGLPLKANEIQQSTLANYGDEWVGVQYSRVLWENIRIGTPIVERVTSGAIEIPQGSESVIIPLESGDPTWYMVSQAASLNATTGRPDATITSSRMGTGKQTLSVKKLGARVLWSGEMDEDSLIAFAPEVRRKLQVSAAEALEHVIIDGDTETGATANINDIAGTPAGSEAFLAWDGFRKLALVTNTANSRDGGAFSVEDYLETLKLLGVAGKSAQMMDAVAFIQDPNVNWKALTLPEVKTRDSFSSPTVENGMLTSIWGRAVMTSYQMHRASLDNTGYEYKTNANGLIDIDTPANNTKGALLAVRWDQWKFGFKRRITMEATRYSESDANQIVAMMRAGMVYRDTEAAAISYNLTI